jgi:hypothetical protein|tara:strand:+ start:2807 stop:2941 length:135 start_codon:yes stop_codon:yes gene_type:complete
MLKGLVYVYKEQGLVRLDKSRPDEHHPHNSNGKERAGVFFLQKY